MLKRCNYCMILIIFIVNTVHLTWRISSSSQGTVTKGGSDCLYSSYRVTFALSSLSQTVVMSACSAITYLYVSSATFIVSNSVMFVYILIYALLLYALAFHRLALT